MEGRYCNRFCGGIIPPVAVLALITTPTFVPAEGATRDLPDCYGPGVALTVSIAIQPPQGTSVVGLEDVPPAGWIVSNISNSGVFDAANNKIKWGPFFEPFPEGVTYDVTPPITETGTKCFSGTVCFDGNNQSITGNDCVSEPGPCDDGDVCTESDVCTNGVCAGTPIPGCGEITVIYDFSTNGGVDRFAFGTYTDSWAEDLEGIRRQCPEVCTEVTTITPDAYDRLALSDATGDETDPNRYINPEPGQNDESTLVVEFNVAESPAHIKQIDVLWEGFGAGTGHLELYVWDCVQGNWGDGQGHYGENKFMDDGSDALADFLLTGAITTNASRYVEPTSGRITLLIYHDQKKQASFHDYVSVTVTSVECLVDGDCDDGLFCNGAETCDVDGVCQPGADPCGAGAWCDETGDACIPHGNGDFDGDGDVDLGDFADFQVCFGQPVGLGCEPANMTGADEMIDLDDAAEFVQILTGPQ